MPLSGHPALRVGVLDGSNWLGPPLATYRMGGTVWGLPIDAATQHAVYRADLMGDEPVPHRWTAAIALGHRLRKKARYLGMAVTTPHGILTIASLMANLGCAWETRPDHPFAIDRAGFSEAYGQLQMLLALCPPDALSWNAIDLHEAMMARDDVVYCPCAYGYGTYGEADFPKRLSFGPFAGLHAPFHAGSTVGGTGLALSRASRHPADALRFLAFVASDLAQHQLIPSRHGQPAAALAWHDPEIDVRFNGFFSAARASIEAAWVRPRYRGYIDFQAKAGQITADGLAAGDEAAKVWTRLEPLLATVNS